jgi:putative aldouronate transport system permease protein
MSSEISERLLAPAKQKTFIQYFLTNKALYVMLIPGLLNLLLFKYLPMWGLVISFQQFHPAMGIAGSKWVGFKHYIDFFSDPYFFRIIRNTLLLGLFTLMFMFPAPIVFALLLNELRSQKFKRVTQTISYMPHFLSIVVVVGLLRDLTSSSDGAINQLIVLLGGEKIHFFTRPEWFRPMYIASGVWQGVGFGSIIYLAAIAGINPELYESAVIDGANRPAQIWHITIPSILPTIMILFILAVGGILGNDFHKILLMYSPFVYETADVIATYIYRVGIESAGSNFSYASAVGFFSALISLVFLLVTNKVAKTLSEYSLW